MISNASTPPEFPAGPYNAPGDYDEELKTAYTELLAEAPEKIKAAVEGLDEAQLDTKYKNWSIRQIVHHLADSHMNAYIRFKWTLTEDSPLIKSYDETNWSEVVDARTMPLESSLALLEGLHARWAGLIQRLDLETMKRTYFHPETACDVALYEALPNYVWHTDHHVAQIAWIREHNSW